MKMSDERANELKQMQSRFDAEPEQLPVNQALKQAMGQGVLRAAGFTRSANTASVLIEHAQRVRDSMEAEKAHNMATNAYYKLQCEVETHLEQDGFDNVNTDCIELKTNGVTSQKHAVVVELQGASGYHVRVVSTKYSVQDVSYSDALQPELMAAQFERITRRLMEDQYVEARCWLDAHPSQPAGLPDANTVVGQPSASGELLRGRGD